MEDSNLSLPNDVRAALDAAVNDGGYPGPTELIRDLLADYRNRREVLADALEEGERSGFEPHDIQSIIAEARAIYDAG